MNERYMDAINKLNDKVKDLETEVKVNEKNFNDYKTENNQLKITEIARKLERYHIVDNMWYYDNFNTGISAKGDKGDAFTYEDFTEEQLKNLKGEPFTFDDLTLDQIALLTGADGIDGKDGVNGIDGRDGIDGKDGKDGIDGKDGKDGITPELEIGEIKSVSTYDPAKVTLKKKKNKYIIDMDIPRGRPGSNGSDGSNGSPALINGVNTLNIEAGDNINLDQEGDTLTISSTSGGNVDDVKVDGVSVVDENKVANIDLTGKQNVTDNTLNTNNKTVPTAINEVNSIAKGANQAISYGNYSTMITAFNALDDDVYRLGQNIYIETLEVPDLWIISVESTSVPYTYTTDAAFITHTAQAGGGQVGYYKIAQLETQKVDLTDYVKNTDYATSANAGVVKTGSNLGILINQYGNPYIDYAQNADIDAKTSYRKPIVPAQLNYAVASVKATQAQSGTAKMWTSTNEDDEIGLNISTE